MLFNSRKNAIYLLKICLCVFTYILIITYISIPNIRISYNYFDIQDDENSLDLNEIDI